MIAMDGKYQYRNGESATILKTDLKNSCPVVSTDGRRVFYHWSDGRYFEGFGEGQYESDDGHVLDLIPIPSPPEYVPYDDSDRDEVRGKWIKSKYSQSQYCIVAFNEGHAQNLSWQAAFENWTYLDGGIFGKIKK